MRAVQGDKPHAGFPEAAYHGMAERLARAGHKVKRSPAGTSLLASEQEPCRD